MRELKLIFEAEEEAIRREIAEANITVSFRIHYRTEIGESISVCGSARSVGSWDQTKSVEMLWQPGDFWLGSVKIRRSKLPTFQYKYLIKRPGDRYEWETCSNHCILALPRKRDSELVLNDYWNFPGYSP